MGEGKASWGVLGILYAVALIVGTILVVVGGSSEQDVERESFTVYAPTMAENGGVLLASMWAFNVGNVLLVGYVAHLYSRARAAGVAVAWAAGSVALAAFLFLVETLLTIGVIDVAAPYAVGQGFEAGHPFVATVDTLMTVRNVTALLAGGLLALGAVLTGVASRRGGPRRHRRTRRTVLPPRRGVELRAPDWDYAVRVVGGGGWRDEPAWRRGSGWR